MPHKIIKKCSVKECDKKSSKNGFCLHHNYKNKRYGDPNHIIIRPIAKTKAELREVQRKAEEKYRQSEKGKTTKRKYNSSSAGKQRQAKYEQTVKGKSIRKKVQKKHDDKRKDTRKVTDKVRRDKPEYKKKIHDERISLRTNVLGYLSKYHSKSEIPCCRCCGENVHLEFLSVDHISGKKKMDFEPELIELGYSSKKEGVPLLKWLIENKYQPKYFQSLCHNCNQSKGHSKDNTCAHMRKLSGDEK